MTNGDVLHTLAIVGTILFSGVIGLLVISKLVKIFNSSDLSKEEVTKANLLNEEPNKYH